VCHAVKVPPTARTAERVTKRAGLAAWLSPPCRLACCAVRPVPESAYVRSLFSAHVSLLIPQISDCTLCLKSGKIVRGKRAVTGDRHGGSHSKCERFGCRLLAKSRLHLYRMYAHRTASHCQYCGLEIVSRRRCGRCCCASLQSSKSGGRFAWVVSNIKLGKIPEFPT